MQIHISLVGEQPIFLPFSYYPQLSAAVYQTLAAADESFAHELHDGEHRNRIKLFGFSPLHSRQTEMHKSGMLFKGRATFRICSPIPDILNRLGEGLLKTGEFRVGSQLLRAISARVLPPPEFVERLTWRPLAPASIVTSWSSRDNTGTTVKKYIMPDARLNGAPGCAELLVGNVIHKWKRLCEWRPDIAAAWTRVQEGNVKDAIDPGSVHADFVQWTENKCFHCKRHEIKKGTVKSWQAGVILTAPAAIQRLAYACGLGEMNAMGFGLVEVGG